MAMTLADIRTKYPDAYKGVDDKTLADAIYQKYYPQVDRREFDARIGLKPYQSDPEGFLKTVQNLPASIAESKYNVSQMGADTLQGLVDPHRQVGLSPPLDVTPGAPIADLVNQKAAPTIEGEAARDTTPSIFNPLRGRSLLDLLPDEAKRAVGEDAAKQSLAAQLRAMEARKQQAANPVDMKPGIGADIAQGLASAVEMIPPAAASVAVRNPAPLVAYFTARSAGQGYGEAMQAGAGADTARAAAGLYAAAEAVTEAVAGKVFVEGGKTLIRSVLKAMATEGATEGATEAIQALVDAQVIGEDMTLDQALTRIKSATIGGAVAGAPVATLTHALRGGHGEEATPGIKVNEPVAEAQPAVAPDTPIEDRVALPAPEALLALPSPEAFAPPVLARRQPAAPVRPEERGITDPQTGEADYQARIALQRSKQAETKELLQTARETITPLGTFSKDEVGGDAAQRVAARRVQTGRPLDAPITIEEMARAKVPQSQIDAVIAARRPATMAKALTPLDIVRSAKAKNIISTDSNFGELAYRTVGSRDPMRMSQAQLSALKSTIDALPVHANPVTVPIADAPVFDEGQYGKALDALRRQGRYTAQAIKDATGLKTPKDVNALRDAMVRRGQLVQRSPSDFRLYDVLGAERQSTPDDLPPGAFKEYVVKRVPVSKLRLRRDGKLLPDVHTAGSDVRARVSQIRAEETKAGKPMSTLAIEPAADVAHGVLENRYDEAGNLLGQVVVDTHRDLADAQKAAERLNNPDVGARYTATPVTPNLTPETPARPPLPQAPPALAGRTGEVLRRLNQLAKERALPLINTRVSIAPEIKTPDGRQAEGQYVNKLISLAASSLTPELTTEQVIEQLARVMDHETIHALRKAGVLGPETDGWRTIVRYARRAKQPGTSETYMERAKRLYAGEPGYNTEADIEEEAIAEAFRHWAANRRNVVGKPATVFAQLVEWFKRLFRSIPDDVFSSIETGSLVRDALTPPGSAEPRATATRAMEQAAVAVSEAQAAKDENLVRVKSRAFIRARAQAREDRYGRSGPKTVLGTTPSKAYQVGEIGDRDFVAGVVDRYKAASGLSTPRLMTLLPEPIEYLKKIADVQQRAAHTPSANDVAKAYRALIDETKAMFRALGPFEVETWTGDGAPYASPAEMLADIAAGHLRMRLSDDMFGPGVDNPGHPMNAVSGMKTIDGRDLTNNDLFRVVHDVYGHGQSGFRDDPQGAYNAYHEHARLLSAEARRALATETLAQRAWQDYGAHLRRRDGTVPRATDVDYLPPNQKEFAQQKAFALDDESLAADPGFALAEAAAAADPSEFAKFMVAYHGTPHKVNKFSSDKIGTGEGAQAFGYGLYFAGKKEVAEHYRSVLSGGKVSYRGSYPSDASLEGALAAHIAKNNGDFERGLSELKSALKGYKQFERELARLNAGEFAAADFKLEKGNLYKVDIPDDDELLDWDAPLSEQPLEKKIRDMIADMAMQASGSMDAQTRNAARTAMLAARNPDLTGEGAYLRLSNLLRPAGGKGDFGGDRAASEALREAGIPGHRYLEGASRTKPAAIAGMRRDLAAWESRLAKNPNDAYVQQEVDARRQELADAEKGISHNYVIYDDNRVQILEENPKFSRFDENLPGGRLYGNPNRSPGGALSKPDTPSPAFSSDRAGNRFFGGELADRQLQMARDGDRGAAMVYLSPEEFLALTSGATNPEQAVYDAAIDNGYKFAGLPSFVLDGYAGNVRAAEADGAFAARALTGRAESIPVLLYPKRAEGLGFITALEAPDGTRVPFPRDGFQEFIPANRGTRHSTNSAQFRRWFGDSKVVDENGAPLVVYHGTRQDFNAFEPNTRKTEQLGFGIHFSVDDEFASRYATDDTVARKGKSPRTIAAYLSAQNVLKANRLVREGEPDFDLAKAIAGKKLFTTKDGNGVPSTWLQNAIDAGSPAQAQQAIQAAGYDGVEYESRIGAPAPGGKGANISGRSRSFIVFEPTQIKSAIANNGNYDIADPDIRYSLNAPLGERVPSEEPGPMFNILQQRTDGWVGKAINAIGRSKSHIPVIGSIFDARIKLQDKMLSIKEMIEQIKEQGGSITDLNDTYMLEQLYHGKVFDQISEREQTLQIPLLQALKAAHDSPQKVMPKDLEDYLYALHAPERNAYLRARGSKLESPSGMSDAEASAILDRLALDGKMPYLEDLEAMVRDITTDTTATRIAGGLISPDTESPYRRYVPLKGFAEEDLDPGNPTENQTRARSGKGFTVGGREDRAVTGRERKAGDLLGHLFLQNTEAVIRAQKNEVALSFMRLLQENADKGFGQILKTAPTRKVVGANGMIHEAGDPSYRQQPDIIVAKWRGKEIVARVADPRLARAIRSDYVTTSNDLVNGLVNVAGKLNRYLATVNTSLNPEFLISNLARDMQTAGLLSQQYDIPNFGRKIIGNAPKAMAGIREVLRKDTVNGEWAKAFAELQQAGGTTEFLGIHDLETQVKRIQRNITQTGLHVTARKARDYIGTAFKFVNDYNKVAENAFRLSAYRAAREAGVSVPQAAYLAKNLTINFNKGGELKGFMNAMYLFYNASTQGTAVLMNGLKSKRVQRLVAGVVVAGVLQDIINRAISGDDDDNGVTDYDDIPDYVLETNFVLMDPLGLLKSAGIDKGYFAIPMPYGFNAFYNLGRNMSAGFSGSPVRNPASSAVDSLMTFTSAFNPLGGVQSIWNFIAPTFADPFVDTITNKDFAGNDIVPERPTFGLPVPESQKYWSNTSEIPVDIAAWINSAVGGGNEVRPGKPLLGMVPTDISPETLQYAFDYATGSMGKFAQRVAKLGTDTVPKALQGDFADINIGDIPFARRVVGSIGQRGATDRYYSVAQEVQTVAAEMKMYEERGDVAAMREKLRTEPVEVRLIPAFEEADKVLQKTRKDLRDLRANENVDPKRKRELELAIKLQQDTLMARLTQMYFTMKKGATP